MLKTEKLSRAAANLLLYFGLAINLVALLFLGGQYFLTGMVKRDLVKVERQTEKASTDLMFNAYNALQSDTIKHMVRIQQLLDALRKIDGTLLRYELNGKSVEWEALVPAAFSNCTGELRGCQVVEGLEPDGRVRIRGAR